MRAILRRDLTAALRARDRIATSALRSALAAIENAETPPVDPEGAHEGHSAGNGGHIAGSVVGHGAADVQRRHLTELDLCAIVEAEVRERTGAAHEYEQVGRADIAQRLRSEADVLARYLSRAQ